MNNWKTNHVQINVDDLTLDLKNPRTDTGLKNVTEDGLIKELLEEDVLVLAKDIAKNGYLAVSTLMVVKEGEKNVVIDGNRRLLATKILNDPRVIKKHVSDIKFKSVDKISKSKVEDVSSLNAIIYPERKNAEHEMAIMHLTGLALQRWKLLRQYRYFQKRLIGDVLSIEGLADSIKISKDKIKKGIKTFQLYEIARKKLPNIKTIDGKSIYSDRDFKTDKFQRAILNEEGERFLGYYFSDEDQKIIITNEEVFIERMGKVLIELYDVQSKYFASAQFSAENKIAFFQNIELGFLPKKKYEKAKEEERQKIDSGQKSLLAPLVTSMVAENSNSTEQKDIENSEKKLNQEANENKRKSVKNRPIYKRKKIPSSLEKLIKECYDLDATSFPNAKTALTRVTFECALKYVVENTKYNTTTNISESSYFSGAFYKKGDERLHTNFKVLRSKFIELIKATGKMKAFESFDLEIPHQIIHNYNVCAVPANATALCDNLMVLLEFLLQEEKDLLPALDLSKL